MKSGQILASVFLGVLLGSAVAVPLRTWAYNNYDNICGKWPYGGSGLLYRPYRWGNEVWEPYTGAFQYGKDKWNATATPVWWYYDGNQAATFFETYYQAGDYRWGYATGACSWGQIIWYDAFLNRWTLDGASTNIRRHTAGHEQGHVLGLGHSTVTPAMMIPGASQYYMPQADDTCGINHVYPSSSWPPQCGY